MHYTTMKNPMFRLCTIRHVFHVMETYRIYSWFIVDVFLFVFSFESQINLQNEHSNRSFIYRLKKLIDIRFSI